MSTYTTFVDKLKQWYEYHFKYHLPHRDKYKEVDDYVKQPDITAADEINAFNTKAAYREDQVVMDNAAHHQMELRRCMNERDIPIDVYWARWDRWLHYEYDIMIPFKAIVDKKHGFMDTKSKPAREAGKKYFGDGVKLFDEMFIDPIKTVEPDNGTK